MCRLNHCCFCIGLRVGAILISIIDTCYNAFSIYLIKLSYWGKTERSAIIQAVLNVMLIAIHFTACILLIVGIIKKNTKFFIPWMLTTLVLLAILIVVRCLSHLPIPMIIISLVYQLIRIYFWICVYSYYKKLDAEQEQQQQ